MPHHAVRVAICAPARPITPADAAAVTALAADMPQLDLMFHPQCFAKAGHFAGTDAQRLAALLECANDPAFDAVWFARGGYGSNRIAEAAIAGMNDAARTKAFLGYSDTGYLLGGLYRAGIGQPAHAPMPGDIRREGGAEAVRRALRWLAGERWDEEPAADGHPRAAFNLTTLAMLCGTPLMPDLTGHVVLVEEVSEHLYAVDRLFFHITAHLGGVAGLRLGRIGDVPENDVPFGADEEAIARDWCARSGIPYLGRADIGHDIDNKIVAFGLEATLPNH
ncbi:LD-carboxypeptidase [Novosphingobium sp. PASSN1]|uniref:LD-carboxypeptidase n=1 Tax=Novosphingobium sp. PASSN1 TaxID=2015561 RepID=UPI000BD49959|nr:LD-carboxypeptidase [Novosphingobium sp. PASSN1]OYU35621.1 MAG: LD-carboxypeptidase [Novosphingobium sp. PASSN1]